MYFYPEKTLLQDVWDSRSANMKAADFREILVKWSELVISYQVKYGLTDSTNLRYVVDTPEQVFIAPHIKKAIDHGFVKHAILLPNKDIFVEVGMEMSVDEANDKAGRVATYYFETKEKALEWLGITL